MTAWGNSTRIAGSFYPNGAGAINNAANQRGGFTVTYSATGVYTVVLDAPIKYCIGIFPALQLAADADAKIRCVSRAVSAAGILTFVLHCVKSSDGVTGVAPAADAQTIISFDIDAVILGSK